MPKWLIITGAGASVNLNSDPGHPIAQMGQWAQALRDELDRTVVGLAAEIGLNPGMGGEEFETALGHFLAWSRALPIAQSLRGAGYEALGMAQDDKIDKYFTTAISRAKLATAVVHKVLFELFGRNKFNPVNAAQAYGGLLKTLNATAEDYLYLATTNYDISLELAFEQLEYQTVTGESVSSATSQRSLRRLDRLMEDARPDRVPILYLHGRVGWYSDPDGSLVATDSISPYTEALGEPAILLPDPKKDYSLFPFAISIWEQFDRAISEATLILILGHSLNDQALVAALKRAPVQRSIAISIWPNPDIRARQLELERLRGLFPEAHIIPVDFGPNPSFITRDGLSRWISGAEPESLTEFANPS